MPKPHAHLASDIRNAYDTRDREQLERALAVLLQLPATEKASTVPCHGCTRTTGCRCFGDAPSLAESSRAAAGVPGAAA